MWLSIESEGTNAIRVLHTTGDDAVIVGLHTLSIHMTEDQLRKLEFEVRTTLSAIEHDRSES
jgi:hypothetical protein